MIQLSHWHRDHSGGMLEAVRMITAAKSLRPVTSVTDVDLHPDRPDYRGMSFGGKTISMQADPQFTEIEKAGGRVKCLREGHGVLEDFFHVSGYIPNTALYEKGLKYGVRFLETTGKWETDEEIEDERFLMCNLKGILNYDQCLTILTFN
jgi:7,8-dihydropterin-6-yl-methyl-4-(beta-D-ribofuranosyl)aminobenzene 5'-phosphate synthase